MLREGADRELLAQSDRGVRLVRVDDLDGTKRFVVEDFDDEGVVGSKAYAHDDFSAAARSYALKVISTADASARPALEIGHRVLLAAESFDGDALAELVADDFVSVDHRPLSYPTLDKAAYIHANVVQTEPQVWVNQSLHAASAAGSVSTASFWTLSFGSWVPFEGGVYLAIVRNNLLARAEVFPDDQVDAALARFDELTSSQGIGSQRD